MRRCRYWKNAETMIAGLAAEGPNVSVGVIMTAATETFGIFRPIWRLSVMDNLSRKLLYRGGFYSQFPLVLTEVRSMKLRTLVMMAASGMGACVAQADRTDARSSGHARFRRGFFAWSSGEKYNPKTGPNSKRWRDRIHYMAKTPSGALLKIVSKLAWGTAPERKGSMKVRQYQIVFTLALATALILAIIAVSRPLAAQAPNLNGTITNQLTHECLQPLDESTVAGAAIVQKPCSSSAGAAQLWTIVAVKSPYFHYVNQLSGMCLDARGGAQNHTPVQQWPCDSISNEYWVYSPVSPGSTSPVFVYSGVAGSYPKSKFCLDVPGGQATSGLPLQIYGCNGSEAQQWF
jgi:hypothetical protein